MAVLPSHTLNGFFGHIDDLKADVFMQQKNSMLPIRSFLLSSRLESFHLLNIEFCVVHSVLFKQFVMVPPYAQHPFTLMKIFSTRRCRLFTGAKPFLALLHIDVQPQFVVASNDFVKQFLLVSIS